MTNWEQSLPAQLQDKCQELELRACSLERSAQRFETQLAATQADLKQALLLIAELSRSSKADGLGAASRWMVVAESIRQVPSPVRAER